MKLREVFQYEVEHRLRSPSTWIYAGILFAIAFAEIGSNAAAGPAVLANAPIEVTRNLITFSIFGLVVSAALFGDAAVRDVRAEMDPLLFTAPLSKAEYLGGRFLAALAINVMVMLAASLGLAVGTLVPNVEPVVFAPFRAGAYVQPWLLFLLPNIVFSGAILFAAGVLTRSAIPVYLAGIGIFAGSAIAANLVEMTEHQALWILGNPIGVSALSLVTEYWTVAERNTRLIGFPAALVWNRALWVLVAVGVLAVLHHRFRFAHPDAGGRRRKGRRTVVAAPSERITAVEVPRVAGSFGFRTTVRQALAVAGNSLAGVAASRWFGLVLLACIGLPLLWGWNVGSTVFDTSTWPVTLLVAEIVLSQRSTLLFYFLIVVFAGELVSKEREVGAAEITDAAPVSDGTALAGRFLALVAMIATFLACAMVGGILIQALQGYYHFEIGLYLRVVFGLNLADYVLIGALAMTIHVLVNHKNLGHIFVLMALGFIMLATPYLGIRHHLLLYGTDPGWTYSDMNGFGPFVGPFVWFKLYWGAWALLLGVVAILLWVRGREHGVRRRLRQARVRFTGLVARTAGVAGALILVLGGFIFYNTNVLNEYRTRDELGKPQAEYEKRYGRYEAVAQPTITSADLRVEIHPDEPAIEIRGSYRLVNRTDVAIDSVHVYLDPAVEARSISLERADEPVHLDEEVGYRIYALAQSLAPGDSLQLAFDVAVRPRGFPNSGIQTDVVANGTSFDRRQMPIIGYQPVLELSDDEARARFGLAPRPPVPGPEDTAAIEHRWSLRDADLVHVDAVIGTTADQVAMTPGVLRRSWTEGGRRYFHYETETPAAFGGSIISAEYAVLEDRWNDVALRIFHHPAHDANLDRMVRGMKASLEYFTEQFGAYPYSELRIVELPRYGGVGSAGPYTIGFTEDVFLSRVREGEVDQPFYGTAHEVAHTWWGGMVRAAPVRGASFLHESLANYSAMLVTETTYGPEMARRVYDFQMARYLRGRANASREVPLLEVEDQSYIAYRKGAIALYTLREHIGAGAVNAALRRYIEKYAGGRRPYPTSLDLYAELRAVTPDSLHALLEDWFETITLWDVRAERAVVEPTGTGEYVVTFDVVAKKMRADSVGNETDVPMDDFVEIGVFAPGEGAAPGERLYLQQHRIRSGEQTIRITVPREPARAGIDPYHKLIDRQGQDNVVDVETAGADPAGTGP